MQQVGRWVIPNKGGRGRGLGGGRLRTRVLEETRLETGDRTREGLGGGWGVSAQPTKVRNEGNGGNRLT